MTIAASPPSCGHWRHWNDGIKDEGTGDWETCDGCGRLVCFDLDCDNGWGWGDDGSLLCNPCRDKEVNQP